MNLKQASIVGLGGYLPERVVDNYELSQHMDTSDEWIRERSGIISRRYAGEDEPTSVLATNACKRALQDAALTIKDIDLIFAATLSPDYYFPGIGVQIQDALGANTIGAIDIRGQCSGFTWALSTADAYIRSGMAERVLVVGAERHSPVLGWDNHGRDVAVLFGDGAGAVVLQAEPKNPEQDSPCLIDHMVGVDGSGLDHLMMERPGMGKGQKEFITHQDLEDLTFRPRMQGRQVFKHAVTRMSEIAESLISRNNLTVDDIDLFVPHQANIRIIEAVGQKTGFPADKVVTNIKHTGNTTAATIPLALEAARADGRLQKGSLVLTAAFGAGFTWGGNLFRW